MTGVAPIRPDSRDGDRIRRVIDILVVLVAAPFVLVVLGIVAVVIKLDTPGPVFFRDRRMGYGGRTLTILKLRTMVENAEELKASLRHLSVLPWPDFKIPNDPRITRVGRRLRRSSLDELPQLWNVLRGDLTLVGPRPSRIRIEEYELWQTERLEARPGLFGRWQFEGRARVDFTERCRMDIRQVRDRSILHELQFAVRTVTSVATGKGAS
jgi:lipopolysaccharide/colanic/teichoic acid biosynthesis glycosyltransferase